ncbi:helix-turn-helix transcriptional regulator [Pseudofrankia asymbiotica]|uniref:LuxR family transcriptional regulator n=1 Tax=Pseudofrankia asymbiotica TaxID=1834516 RepID=A0A1V2IAS8_9ACTN|nr:helix-turn-helix transcriptional regulator [Pseudofrankia asymbiotica]ONH30308.1 LuxR family transcriptional regulator [Pseudofrankia asymbiotica]
MTQLASSVFVGRAAELARLEGALRRAADGDGAGVIIGGEAGVGKTRLVEEVAARAAAAGHTVLAGGCVELEGDGLPLAPVVEALRGLARRIGPEALARLAGGRRDELARLLPEVAGPVAIPAAAADDAQGNGIGNGIGRLFDLVLGVVETLSAEHPVLFVIEDLHWADHSTRALAAFLLRNLRGCRATLVLTYRADGVGPGHPLRTFLAESERLRWMSGSERLRWVERIELARFGRADVTELVAAILGEAPPDQLVDAVMARSDGNAFFVEELVCAAGAGGVDTISPTLRDALLARIEALPAATRHLLRVAAAGGQRVEHRLLAAVLGLPEEQLWDALRAAVATGVLMVAPADDAYCFRHALTRSALRHEALPGELSHLHRRYAQALEADPGLVGGGARAAAAVAYHWYAACDHSRALPALLTAARAAACAYAFAEALRHYERALASWDEVPDAAERAGLDHLGVLEAAITAAKMAGELRRGLDLVARARAEAALLGDPVRLALALTEQSFLLRMRGHSDGVAEAREALRVMPAEPPTPTRAKILVSLGKALSMVPRRAAALEAIEEALAIARATGARRVEATALMTTGCLASTWTLPEDARLGRAIAHELNDDDLLLSSYTNESDTWLGGCRFDEAVAAGREGLRLARRLGQERTHGLIIAGNVIEALFGAGRWDEAEKLLAETTELAPMGIHALFLEQLRGELALAGGRLDEAATALASAEGTLTHRYLGSQYTMPLLRLRIDLDVRRGEPGALTDGVAGALSAVRAVETFDFTDVVRYAAPLLASAMGATAEAAGVARALRAGDDLRRALDAAGRVAALAAEMPFERAVSGEACSTVIDGELARAEGRPDPEAWERAAKSWAALGVPYQSARARYRRAEALLAVGDRAAAGDELRAAAVAADTLGAHLLRHDLRLLAAQGRLVLPGPESGPETAHGECAAATTDGPPLGLTAREVDVLRLVAAGSTNPQIAAALFISRKTASTHVSNILGKLGVTSRGEAAAVAHRLRLFDGGDVAVSGPPGAGR